MLLNFLFPVAGVSVIYVFICLALLKWQNRFIFLPSSQLKKTPDDFHLNYEDVWVDVEEDKNNLDKKNDNNKPEKLHGWWIPEPIDRQGDRGTVLFLHGNSFNIGANLKQTEVFYRLGLSVFIIDYRGYGKSKGEFPTESQVYEDARIALAYLNEQRNIPSQEIIVYGHSLGGAIAIELATQNPNLAALIIQGSFTSLRDMIDYDKIFTIFPVDWLLKYYFDSIAKISALQMPLLFVHGDRDRRVPEWMSHKLYETAKTSLKDIYIVSEGDHDHIPEIGGKAYFFKLKEFIEKVKSKRQQTTNNQQPITNNQ